MLVVGVSDPAYTYWVVALIFLAAGIAALLGTSSAFVERAAACLLLCRAFVAGSAATLRTYWPATLAVVAEMPDPAVLAPVCLPRAWKRMALIPGTLQSQHMGWHRLSHDNRRAHPDYSLSLVPSW